ncbi:MAG: ABC transporter substrate-binding protein [Gemmatimonadaceae bacterium]
MILAARPTRATVAAAAAMAMVFAGAGCADRTPPVVGVAMGFDAGMSQSVLPARQQRFNDSVRTRHQVALRMPRDSAEGGDALTWANVLVHTAGLVGVVGHEGSRSSLQAAPVYRDRGVVQIVPTGTSSKLASVSPWTFPLVASDSLQGRLLAQYIVSSGRKRLTLFVQDDEYGRGIVTAIQNALSGTDVQILENVMHTPLSDYALLVRSMFSHVPKPDVLALITQGSIAIKVAQLAWMNEPTLLVLGSDATISSSSELRALAPAPDQLALVTYWLPDTTNLVTQAFLRDFHAVHPGVEAQWNHAALYDAVGLLNSAAADVGGNPKGVRDWLLSLGRSRPQYRGVLGLIDFTGQHAVEARLIRPSPAGWELVKNHE